MMKPTWLIERNTFDDGNPEKMAEIVKSLGMETRWFFNIPFEGGLTPDNLPGETCAIVYGSINTAKYVSRKLPWIPGVWCDFKTLRCTTYLAYWGRYSVHSDYAFLPLSEVHRQKDVLFQIFGNEKRIFIRPDDNAKSFHGEVVAEPQFEKWYEVSNFYNPGPECLTLVSRPSTILSEWRFVIANKKILTGSQYKRNGKLKIAPQFDDEAATVAETIANYNSFNPHPIYVMDIAYTAEEGYRLMEIGSVNCSGLYACDLRKIVEKASEIALAEWQDLQIEERENSFEEKETP